MKWQHKLRKQKLLSPTAFHVTGVKVRWATHAFGCKFQTNMDGLSARIVIANWFTKIIRNRPEFYLIQFGLSFFWQIWQSVAEFCPNFHRIVTPITNDGACECYGVWKNLFPTKRVQLRLNGLFWLRVWSPLGLQVTAHLNRYGLKYNYRRTTFKRGNIAYGRWWQRNHAFD